MSFPKQVIHIGKAMKESGFIPDNAILTGKVDAVFKKGVNYFLDASPGKNVERVLSAFRSTKTPFFLNVSCGNEITPQIRIVLDLYISVYLDYDPRQNPKMKCSGKPELETMERWEKEGFRPEI